MRPPAEGSLNQGTALPRLGEPVHDLDRADDWTRYLVPVGRILFAGAHVVFSPLNFSREAITMSGQAGVPLPGVGVPLAAVISLAGGLSIILGYWAKLGAWLLVLFLVPVTLFMHNFWAVKDPMMAQMQEGFFIGNLSRIGACLLIAHFGAGPLSLDARAQSRRT